MKNGEYNLVIAPEEYPGKLYRGKYCYEHHLIYWQNYGIVPNSEEVIHHKDGNKRNNNIENLELMNRVKHIIFHDMNMKRNMVLLECPICHRIFSREKHQTHLNKPTNKATYCSRNCAAKAANTNINIKNNVIREYKAT